MMSRKFGSRGFAVQQVISVLYELAEQGGGVTRVSLGRTAALVEAGVNARIAVLDFDERLDTTIRNLVDQGRIPETVKVLNFYKWFACKALEVISPGVAGGIDSNIEHLQVKVGRRIDHINGANVSVVRYITIKGYVYLEEFQNHLTGGVMVVISMPGKRPLKFNSLDAAHAYWLKCLSVECLPSFIVADSIGAADAVCSVEGDDIYRVLMMHSNHLLKPYRVGGAIAPKYHGVIRGLPHCDRLVLLTRGQLHDMQQQFPSGRYSVIGNLVTLESQDEPVLREANLAVIVSRLHGVKRIKSMVSAFAKVVAINPDARLEIWGSGDQEEEIKALILKLGMQDSIQVMGFATSVSRIFRRASVSLGMSATEGFGISFAESLGYGTPLVSMRTNYGPQEIVADGEDGFIVDAEDEFVEKICLLLGDSALVRPWAVRARSVREGSRLSRSLSSGSICLMAWLVGRLGAKLMPGPKERFSRIGCRVKLAGFICRKRPVSKVPNAIDRPRRPGCWRSLLSVSLWGKLPGCSPGRTKSTKWSSMRLKEGTVFA